MSAYGTGFFFSFLFFPQFYNIENLANFSKKLGNISRILLTLQQHIFPKMQ